MKKTAQQGLALPGLLTNPEMQPKCRVKGRQGPCGARGKAPLWRAGFHKIAFVNDLNRALPCPEFLPERQELPRKGNGIVFAAGLPECRAGKILPENVIRNREGNAMLIRDIFGGTMNPIDSIIPSGQKREDRDEQPSAPPASWGSDRVSISPEARAAAAAQEAPAKSAEEENSPSAGEEFAAYMKSKRSKAQGGSAKERVKQLQNKLRSLQSQLAQATASESKGGSNQVKELQAQISSVVAQIAEASAQAAEEALGES